MIEIFLGIALLVIAILIHWVLILKSNISELKKELTPDPQGYSKFLEDSREAAFGYIEQVQSAIVDLKQKTESKNKAETKDSYNRLISLLPEDN
jgi:hypothetical protein